MTTTTTAEYGVMFKDEMVRAILAGRKTQTRRTVQEQHEHTSDAVTAFGNPIFWFANRRGVQEEGLARLKPPHGVVGGKLYAKECWREDPEQGRFVYRSDYPDVPVDSVGARMLWNSSMFMPARAARIWLRTTVLRLERLSDITREDCIAEGVTWACAHCEGRGTVRGGTCACTSPNRVHGKLVNVFSDSEWGCSRCGGTIRDLKCVDCILEPRRAYMKLLSSIHDKKPGDNIVNKDPWLWVYTFERLEGRHG